jgi:hypothetical protein
MTSSVPKPPPPVKIMKKPARYAVLVQQLTAERRIDAVKQLLDDLDRYLAQTKNKCLADEAIREGLLTLVLEAPADLRGPLLARLGLQGHE